MVATLERLGALTSFSRPRGSDDNPFFEAFFRAIKYRPEYPRKPFSTVDAAADWVDAFVRWYSTEHRHSGIAFVTFQQRHAGADVDILAERRILSAATHAANHHRWSGEPRRAEAH